MNVRYAVVLVKIIVKRKIGNLWCRGRLGFDSLKRLLFITVSCWVLAGCCFRLLPPLLLTMKNEF